LLRLWRRREGHGIPDTGPDESSNVIPDVISDAFPNVISDIVSDIVSLLGDSALRSVLLGA